MDEQNLRALLEQLHRELMLDPPTDERSRALLLELRRDIERAVAPREGAGRSVAPAEVPHNFRERLQEAVAGFEGSHPQSAAALERAMVLLSNFGL